MSVAASAGQVCEWASGQLLRGRPDQLFTGTVIDSREARSGDLFVAIVGPNHDAHRFAADVLARGAAGILIESGRIEDTLTRNDGFIIHVDDTTKALADVARGHRQGFSGPLIGITGSNGKTTTKELCADILGGIASTLATRGNLNNNFGVPLTLLRRSEGDVYAVIEIGMNHRGEIAQLAEIAQPTIGVLTNVGTAHIEYLGSRETIAEEKGDLLASLPADGVAIVGRDEPTAFAQAKRTRARVLSFGRHADADLCASGIHFLEEGIFAFELESPFGRGEIRVPGLAETMVENALAAAGAAFAAGASFEAVVRGLANHSGVPGRMHPRLLSGGILVIDDAYNANPQSMRNALETLARLETSGRRIAVLGQMGELGDATEAAHREIGECAGALGLDLLFVLGTSAERVAEGARHAGLDPERIHIAQDHDSLSRRLRAELAKGDRVLFKGSRSAGMERIIHALEGAD